MKITKELTREDLRGYKHNMTVADLKKFIAEHNIPDTALVMIQRVEDVYFEKCSWGVYLKEGENAWYARQHNKNIKDEEYLNERPEYKAMVERGEVPSLSEEEIREFCEQYHPAWSCVGYKDDKDLLFIDLHY